MSTIVENTNPVTVDIEPKYSVTTQSGAIVENEAPEYSVSVQRKEYKVVGDNIYIPRLYDDAPQWMKDLVNTVVDVKTAVAVGNLDDALEALRTLANELDVAKNTYTKSIISSNDIDKRINTAIETLNSSLAAADATILNIAQTATTPAEAYAISINTLSASLSASGEIGSFIANMNSAFADLDSATTQSINFMESAINAEFSANATALNTIRTYVGIDEAGASTGTGLSAYLEDSNGTIGGADSQLANTIRVTAEGVESKFAYNSVVNINGIYKKSGFGLTTNYTSGAGTQANPYVSEFWIDATKLRFTNSNATGRNTPFTIDASGITPEITFNGKVSFSNVTNTTGTGSNLLYNSAPKIGSETKGWYVWTNSGMTVNLSAGWNEWKPTGGASVAANIGGNPSIGSVYDVGQSLKFPVIAGSRYEASAYISAHRSNSRIYLIFYDIAGNHVVESGGNVINYSGSSALVNWGRSSVFATAPSNAATALLIIRSVVVSNDPYCFVTNAFAGVAEANQTTPSNWSEGTSAGATYISELSNDSGYLLPAGVANAINTNTTTINGSKITTGSIGAAQITTGSIGAAQIDVGNLFAQNITYTGVITGGNVAGGGIIKSYNGNMIIDLKNGSIYIS